MSESHLTPAAEFWADHIRRQLQSGHTIRVYCELHDLAPATFYFWRRRLQQPSSTPAPQFHELHVSPEARPACALVLRHPAGWQITLPENFSETAVRRLLVLLADAPC